MTTKKTPIIPMHGVKSSQVESIGHDVATSTLAVKFSRGGLYHYHGVSADQFKALQQADSVGSHLGKHIKPNHKYVRIEG